MLFSGLFITSFRKWKPFVSYKEGDDNVACKSKPIVTSPESLQRYQSTAKGISTTMGLLFPSKPTLLLPKVGHPQKPGHHPPPPTSGHLPRPSVAKFFFVADQSRPPDDAWLRALYPPVALNKASQASNHPARPEIVSHYESGGAFIGGNGRYEQ